MIWACVYYVNTDIFIVTLLYMASYRSVDKSVVIFLYFLAIHSFIFIFIVDATDCFKSISICGQ